jgi:hypothetical protein
MSIGHFPPWLCLHQPLELAFCCATKAGWPATAPLSAHRSALMNSPPEMAVCATASAEV